MSSVGVKGTRASIPSDARRMIENIKEITGQKHSDDEIYATLKECSMDPDETLQKLFLLDTFHEVKRKRDRRKENQIKENFETKKPGPQSRANRTSRYIHSSRHIPNDASVGKTAGKEASTVNLPEKGTGNTSLSAAEDVKRNVSSPMASPITALSNGPSAINSQSNNVIVDSHGSMGHNGVNHHNAAINTSSKPASNLSSSDLFLAGSQDSSIPSAVGTTQLDGGSAHAPVQVIEKNPIKSRPASARVAAQEFGISNLEQKVPNDSMSSASSVISSSTPSRPSSNYNNRSHVNKVAPGKEWKPKSVVPNNDQVATRVPSSEVSLVSAESQPVVLTSEEVTSDLEKKLEKLNVAERQHVIIPDHLHVPEVEKLGFFFGSFDASFTLDMNKHGGPGSAKTSFMPESPVAIDEAVQELQISDQNVPMPLVDTEAEYSEHPQSPSPELENLPSQEVEVSSSTTVDYIATKKEVAPENHPNILGHASSDNNMGHLPPIAGSQLAPSESLDSQAREAPRLPSVLMPQSLDPASYYAQFYGSGMDTDGRISPFHIAEPVNKYGGSATLVSTQTSQTPQEGGVPLVLPTASPTPLVNQAAGVIQGSIPPTHQPLTVFRQPSGVPLPHYNYFPYSPYFSPFYAPPPPFHQFLSNGAFPQQPHPGTLYPAATGTSAKYSVSQYKQGPNSGSSNHLEVPGNYGPYGLSVANYTSSSATAPVTSTSNEEPQAKESNIYVSGQQNEGSGVWFATPNRDIPSIQASPFYHLPQGQLPFAPTQQTHGAFAGIFHPSQAVTPGAVHPLLQQSQTMTNSSEMSGPNATVYQQPQHAQFNWPGNY